MNVLKDAAKRFLHIGMLIVGFVAIFFAVSKTAQMTNQSHQSDSGSLGGIAHADDPSCSGTGSDSSCSGSDSSGSDSSGGDGGC